MERELLFNEKPDSIGGENLQNSISSKADLLTHQWSESAHAQANPHTIGNDGCISCHDGFAFANKIASANELPISTGQDCLSCHAGYGRELKEVGVLNIPTKDNFNAGTGAVCSSCHNADNVPDINNPRRAYPHYGSQADVVSGFGGIRANDDVQFNNTYGHISLDNSCVDCHMPTNKQGFISHTFKMEPEFAELVCASCHQGTTNFNLKAKADYDGNGKIEGMQDEVLGLMNILEKEIIDRLEGGSFATSKGAIVYFDSEGKAISEVSNDIYLASYNYVLIDHDGSKGIHNPLFAVQILQHSYKYLVGTDLPNAFIIE